MEWPTVELRCAAEIRGGATPRRDNPTYWNGDIPWVTPTDLPTPREGIVDVENTADAITQEGLASCSASLLPPGTVLFSSRASIGKIGIASVSLTTNQGFANLIPRSGLESRYLAWCLHFHSDRIAGLAGSTTFKEVAKSALKRFRIPLPPLSEQRRIVEILDQADHLRRLRAEADAKAERILPALFIKMFGDPATNPMGWPKRSISELATVITGNTPSRKKQEYFGDYIEWVKSDNLNTPSHYITPTFEYLSEEGARVGRKALPGSALVTCIAGSPSAIGNVALADREVAFNQQINAAVPLKGIDCYYLYGHFVVGKRLVQAASTGGMKGIVTKNRFCGIEFLAPPSDLQERFGYRCKQVCEQTEARLKQAGLFDRLFSFLLHRAFSGDLTASWREACMEELLQEMEQQATTLKKKNYRGIRQ